MSLPALIEIVPLSGPVHAEITVPGSKSITNRALILAALAQGQTTLRGALWSEDTEVMVVCLQRLGFTIGVAADPNEPCNRTLTVQGLGGKIPHGGTNAKPLELFVANAGTAARFLSALVCLGNGVYCLHGVPRMHQRPQSALFVALRELGCRVDAPEDKLPAVIRGGGPKSGDCTVSIAESSQFASALLLSAEAGGWRVRIVGDNDDESPYVEMTRRLIEVFPRGGGSFQIEPDASSGSYFWAAGWLSAAAASNQKQTDLEPWPVSVNHWPTSGWQIDADFPDFLPLPAKISREGQLGDSIMTAMVVAADQDGGRGRDERGTKLRFTELDRLRVQECERVLALRTELQKCGAVVTEIGDALHMEPAVLHGAEIETYNDHRMAMCFAMLGLKVPGVRLKNPACVKKTFPNFFQKLAAPPPHGLGAIILDATKNPPAPLRLEELFAD